MASHPSPTLAPIEAPIEVRTGDPTEARAEAPHEVPAAPRPAVASGVKLLLSGEHADPRAAQAVVLVPVFLELVLRQLTGAAFDGWFVLGSLVAAVATVGALLIGRGWLSARWTIALPLLDMVALGLYRQSTDTALGVAVVFPAMWLGLQFGRRGVVATTLMMGAAYVVPTLAQLGLTAAAFSRISQMTMMAIIASLVVAVTAELWKAQFEQARTSTEQLRQAMSEVIEQRRLTRSIVNGVDVGLVAIDADGAYDSMNPRQREFLAVAYPEGHLGRAGQTGFVYAADAETPLSAAQMPTVRALSGEAFHDYLIWIGEDPRHRRALTVSSTPYTRGDGTAGGAVLAYHDITDLLAAARLKEEFVASVSHELRTPLTSIIGYVDIVLDDVEGLPEEARAYLATVQRNARRLHRLVDDLLSTALQSVSCELDVEEVSVGDVLARSVRDHAGAAAAAGVTVWLDTLDGADRARVEGDPQRLAQVFDNLLSNAVKYTGAAGHVVASIGREDGEVVVRVRDNGRGIAAHEQGAVFTKFFRSSTVLGGAIPGVGLGLAITKTIVDAHGGSIAVTSEVGRGSTFEVRLPLARADVPVA